MRKKQRKIINVSWGGGGVCSRKRKVKRNVRVKKGGGYVRENVPLENL